MAKLHKGKTAPRKLNPNMEINRISSCSCAFGTAELKAELIVLPNTTWLRYTERATAAREIPVTAITLILALNIEKPDATPITAIRMNETIAAAPPAPVPLTTITLRITMSDSYKQGRVAKPGGGNIRIAGKSGLYKV